MKEVGDAHIARSLDCHSGEVARRAQNLWCGNSRKHQHRLTDSGQRPTQGGNHFGFAISRKTLHYHQNVVRNLVRKTHSHRQLFHLLIHLLGILAGVSGSKDHAAATPNR